MGIDGCFYFFSPKRHRRNANCTYCDKEVIERERRVLKKIAVEAKYPDGRLADSPVEVSLSESGLMIYLEDACGDVFYIHRFAWDNLVKAVNELFEEEKRKSHVALKDLLEREKGKND